MCPDRSEHISAAVQIQDRAVLRRIRRTEPLRLYAPRLNIFALYIGIDRRHAGQLLETCSHFLERSRRVGRIRFEHLDNRLKLLLRHLMTSSYAKTIIRKSYHSGERFGKCIVQSLSGSGAPPLRRSYRGTLTLSRVFEKLVTERIFSQWFEQLNCETSQVKLA